MYVCVCVCLIYEVTYTLLRLRFLQQSKQAVQDLIPPPSIYLNVSTLYKYTDEYTPRFSPPEFFRPSKCLVPTPGLTSWYPTCSVCVCVCVYKHIHPNTLSPPSKTCRKECPPPATTLHRSTVERFHLCPPTQMNKLCIPWHERTCTPGGECVCYM